MKKEQIMPTKPRNFVAKYAADFNRPVIEAEKTKYRRKDKHRILYQ